jgi:formyltetrahydrofolate-dependent phosphoribosylglycinamide formyltransferase
LGVDFIVLSSSKGTTFQAVLDAIANGSLTATCLGLISDKEDRGCVQKARDANILVLIVEKKEGESREDYDKRLYDQINILRTQTRTPNLVIACIGWLHILSPAFVAQWENRIINVHPSLLPRHPGLHAHEEVLASGDTESGMTIHIIDEGVDTGPILLQKTCPVYPDDTVDTLKERVQDLEKEWYPKVLQNLADGTMILPS